ncbi:hypothetical protein [Streptomyces pinistramenti]|uniref:hypothetical protein n=1 Tax=Streptomyces pinistramenti TaxID=2884812 RepID=UPI001D062A6B|nr:hypothetical protein [Streptomyces pinistramenti]MCB5908456.1 hypothetical protein [Streptomyces pinistramenti]
MYKTFRRTLFGALAAGGLLFGATGVSAAQPSGNTAAHAPGAPLTAQAAASSKVYFNTARTQWTHYTPDAQSSSHAGTLNGGRNYFYCYVEGGFYKNETNGRGSNYWLRTDDDTGHRNVYVSDTNLDQYGWSHMVDLLPYCK